MEEKKNPKVPSKIGDEEMEQVAGGTSYNDCELTCCYCGDHFYPESGFDFGENICPKCYRRYYEAPFAEKDLQPAVLPEED